MFDLNFYSDYLLKLGRSPLGRALIRVAVGIVGVLILGVFLAALMTPTSMGKVFPLIVAFNAALTGYGIIDKTRNAYVRKRLVVMVAGGTVALGGIIGLNLVFWQMAGVVPLNVEMIWACLPMGVIAGWLGGALAIKYHQSQ